MQKKLEAELVSLAHNILQMKNKNDVVALKEKAQQLYERLSVLAFVDEYLNTTPNALETKDELVSKIDEINVEEQSVSAVIELLEEVEVTDKNEVETVDVVEEVEQIEVAEKNEVEIVGVVEEIEEVEVADKIEVETIDIAEEIEEIVKFEEEVKEELDIVLKEEKIPAQEVKRQLTLEEEFKDSVSVDVTTNLFTKFEETTVQTKPSLNDKLRTNIQVGLNDRIAFVKHLFNHSQADFNRVLSQLNSFKTKKEAISFVKKMVKPDYDWSGKEEYEERFVDLIERKFL